ncbi:hypothetical protein SAMN05428989_4019 [Pseudoxanthomonas sp. GM95]|uniref:hypothetical protein n=1 Tax=Pseudoxanthomonas sp. GM95 TaxID=1881043 RepID=UPI0008D1A728|nr:hypothetical protein [Pseudoxanthomonas sp. GM95]SEM53616.1 hypothetical protein SAMN05428989_4019 [Pseudoxanthomonas sp. GM95]
MNTALKTIISHVMRTAFFAWMVSLPVIALYIDLHWLKDDLGEWSLVEITQELFLLFSTLAFVDLARHNPRDRAFAVLAAGFMACMLIRELDAVWDLVFHGFWQVLVAVVAASCFIFALQDVRRAINALARLLVSRSGTGVTTGLVLLLFYSRLFGMTALWQGLLGDAYIRVFKNAVEEGTELLGYTFILAASWSYVHQQVKAPWSSAQDTPVHPYALR